jgi:hypothetical protein
LRMFAAVGKWQRRCRCPLSSSHIDGQRWRCGAGGPSPPSPPARSSFPWRCYRVRLPPTPGRWPPCRVWSPPLPRRTGSDGVDGPRINRWPWRCGAGGPSPPPPALVVPLAPRSRSVAAVAMRCGRAVSMARALRGCVCVVAPAPPPPPSALVVPLVAP